MSRQQIHGRNRPDRAPGTPGEPQPSFRMQFHAPVRYENIRGLYGWSMQLEAPVIVWGREGCCWAFFHDFDDRSRQRIVEDCRQATYDRRGPFANPFMRGGQA